MLGAVLEQPGSEVPTMVRTVGQYGMSSFEHRWPGSCFIYVLVPMFLLREPCE